MSTWRLRMKIWMDGEKEKLRGKTLRQKADYILTYYWLWILGIFCAVAIPCYMVRQAVFCSASRSARTGISAFARRVFARRFRRSAALPMRP